MPRIPPELKNLIIVMAAFLAVGTVIAYLFGG
jgi:hypothetical protein